MKGGEFLFMNESKNGGLAGVNGEGTEGNWKPANSRNHLEKLFEQKKRTRFGSTYEPQAPKKKRRTGRWKRGEHKQRGP